MSEMEPTRLRQYREHPRSFRENRYVYPVVSRRGGGLSIGVNLNPDTACNFDCVYCQVDRSDPPRAAPIDLTILRRELAELVTAARDGTLFRDSAFSDLPDALREVRDIAFSGDGEPTACKQFGECVDVVAEIKQSAGLQSTKIILITDACYLTRPKVAAALRVMDAHHGEIWAKLDAGTEAYFRTVNRASQSLDHVIANITEAAQERPVVIQSLFMRVHGEVPDDAELHAYIDRLRAILAGGGTIARVQVYTVARKPAEAFVQPLTDEVVNRIAETVAGATGLNVQRFYGS